MTAAIAAPAPRQFGQRERPWLYVTIRMKFVLVVLLALLWTLFSIWVSRPWVEDLGAITHPLFALITISFIGYVPGFMNAFLLFTLMFDRRPVRIPQAIYPPLSILIAAYQEEEAIGATLASLADQNYGGEIEVLVLNDGSTDGTAAAARLACDTLSFPSTVTVRILDFPANRGKASALNSGLAEAQHDLIVTIDADSCLRQDSLAQIVERLLSDPLGTQAVAGAVLVSNARQNLITGAQEWDYFHGIAAVKRMQSMYHGTLVAQGAFSIYRRDALKTVGGWPDCVGEDIVLTWAMLKRGYRIGYAEDAIVFTRVPATLKMFALQRKRWSRGLVEALNLHEGLLFKPRLTTLFVWWNLLFLPLDLVFTFIFVPGILLALTGTFWIAGPMTLAILPLTALGNLVIYRAQNNMAKAEKLKTKRHYGGLFFYIFFYSLIMQPVCVWGYASEMTGRKKNWGTK